LSLTPPHPRGNKSNSQNKSTYRRTGSGVANQSDSLKGRVIEGLDIEKIKGALN